MSKMRSIKKNYIYNLIYQIFLVLTPLITAPYLSRTLGAEGLGTYGYTLTICSYFILFADLGAAAYGTREIASVRDDERKKAKTFWEIFLLKLLTTGISLGAYIGFSLYVGEYKNLYLILIANLVSSAFDITWFFYGIEEFKNIILRNIVLRALSIIAILVFIKGPDDLMAYVIISAATALLGNIVLWPSLKKELLSGGIKKLDPLKHLKGVIILFIPQIAIQIYTLLDKTMIGVIAPDISEVGYYEQAQKIVKLLLVVVTTLGTVIAPRIAYMHSKQDQAGIEEYILKSFQVMSFIAFPIMCGIIAISEPFVPFFFGDGFEPVKILMPAISPIILFIGASNIIGQQYLLPTRKNKEYTISVIIGALINAAMNFVLIPKYSAFGASISTVVAELCVVLSQMFMVRKQLGVKKIISRCWKYGIASVIMLSVCMIVGCMTREFGSFANLILIAITGVSVYSIILIIMKDEIVKMVKKIIMKRRA